MDNNNSYNKIQLLIINNSEEWLKFFDFDSVKSIRDFIEVITYLFKMGGYIFRGEPALYEFPFSPSSFRNKLPLTKVKYPNKNISDQEIKHCNGGYRYGLSTN